MNFINPLFFIGALATAVPILLHLIKREHAQKIEFPTLMFLRRISKKTIRYQKLRHLLLLLLRILAFLLVVIACARPYRDTAQAAASPGLIAATAHIIMLDNSLSMDYEDRWDRAKKAAGDIVRNSAPADKFAVMEFSDRTVVRTPITNDRSAVLALIERGIELTDRPTRFEQALRTGEQLAMDPGTGKRIIHLISDFQKNGRTAEERDFRLADGIELQYVDIGSDDYSNLTLRDVYVVDAQPGGGDLLLKASAANFGKPDRKNVQISLFVDGRFVADKRVDISGGGSQGVEFALPGLIADMHSIVLEIDDRELTRDNRFYMVLEAHKKTPVPIVEGPSMRGRRSSSFFLSNALNIDILSPYKLTTVSAQNLKISGKLMIWNNAPCGDTALQKRLQEFVRAGGGLAVVLADSSQSNDFNRSFGSWLPVKIANTSSVKPRSGRRPVDDYVLMTDIETDSPIFQPFSRPHSGTFSNARFFDHAVLSVESGAEVLARFDNGDPALVSIDVDKGRVLIFASSADDASNDLPLKAVYAPFWQLMLRYLENFEERKHWLDIGETIAPREFLEEAASSGEKEKPGLDEAIVVLDPDKERLPAGPKSGDIVVDKSGFYEIRSMDLNTDVAVNADPAESDLAHGDPEEMVAGWASAKPQTFFDDEPPTPEEQDQRQQIWKLLLIAALVLFLLELFLSNYKLPDASQ